MPYARPTWFYSYGGATARSSNGQPCDTAAGQTRLANFSTRALLGCALTEDWHNTVRANVGGNFATPTAPWDGLFYPFYNYVETIEYEWKYVASTFNLIYMTPFPMYGWQTDPINQVSLWFDATPAGVGSGAVKVNGAFAINMTGSGTGPYTFTFFPPPVGPVTIFINGNLITGPYLQQLASSTWNFTYMNATGDDDLDGLTNAAEAKTWLTDPTNADTDGDGVSDGAEIAAGTDPFIVETPVGIPPTPPLGRPLALVSVVPNPVRDGTALTYDLPQAGETSITLEDAAGRTVATLMQGAMTAGRHRFLWHRAGAGGASVAPGVYFLRLENVGAVRLGRVAVLH